MKVYGLVLLAAAVAFGQECGQTFVPPLGEGGRITNGVEAVPNSWPWQVAQCRGVTSLRCSLNCGATVINERFILSAAHCVVGQNPNSVAFKYGAHSLSSTEPNGQGLARVARFLPNPRYNSRDITDDIALVELRDPLTFNEKVQPICLSNTDDHIEQDTPMLDIGWGRTGGNRPTSDRLLQTTLIAHSRANCDRLFTRLGHFLHPSVSCGGGLPDLQSVCFGDSGGPYFKKDATNDRYYQYGVNSFVFGQACSGVDRPNGFARVPHLCDFLEEHVPGICIAPPEAALAPPKAKFAKVPLTFY